MEIYNLYTIETVHVITTDTALSKGYSDTAQKGTQCKDLLYEYHAVSDMHVNTEMRNLLHVLTFFPRLSELEYHRDQSMPVYYNALRPHSVGST